MHRSSNPMPNCSPALSYHRRTHPSQHFTEARAWQSRCSIPSCSQLRLFSSHPVGRCVVAQPCIPRPTECHRKATHMRQGFVSCVRRTTKMHRLGKSRWEASLAIPPRLLDRADRQHRQRYPMPPFLSRTWLSARAECRPQPHCPSLRHMRFQFFAGCRGRRGVAARPCIRPPTQCCRNATHILWVQLCFVHRTTTMHHPDKNRWTAP